jgi:hypothetical protein
MVAISLYRGNLHLSGGADGAAPRRWEVPRPAISAKRFRRLVRNRSLAVARLAGEAPPPPRPDSPASPPPSSEEEAGEEYEGLLQDEGQQQGQRQQQQLEEGEVEHQVQQVEEAEEQEEGAVEDANMSDAGEVVVEADGNGDAEEGQGESEGVDPNQEVRIVRFLDSTFLVPSCSMVGHSVDNCHVIVQTADNNQNSGCILILRWHSPLLGKVIE